MNKPFSDVMVSQRPCSGSKGGFRSGSIAALLLTGLLAACQTNTDEVLTPQPEDVVTEADLRAYCPPVVLREGTASFRTYSPENSADPNDIIYQASISDQTRDCRYRNGQLLMTVAVAGRVVAGPKGQTGTVNLPIRVAITQGDATAYSNLDRYPVTVTPSAGASQFLYSNDSIVLPEPTERNLVIYIGFDEGPYDTP